jgi:hypothetical protein
MSGTKASPARRMAARQFACPRCGAVAGSYCLDMRGDTWRARSPLPPSPKKRMDGVHAARLGLLTKLGGEA